MPQPPPPCEADAEEERAADATNGEAGKLLALFARCGIEAADSHASDYVDACLSADVATGMIEDQTVGPDELKELSFSVGDRAKIKRTLRNSLPDVHAPGRPTVLLSPSSVAQEAAAEAAAEAQNQQEPMLMIKVPKYAINQGADIKF